MYHPTSTICPESTRRNSALRSRENRLLGILRDLANGAHDRRVLRSRDTLELRLEKWLASRLVGSLVGWLMRCSRETGPERDFLAVDSRW